MSIYVSPDLRLVGGTTNCSGTLQKRDNGVWVTVQYAFGIALNLNAAQEVCRQLGCGAAISTQTVGGDWSSNPPRTQMTCAGNKQ